MKTKIPWGKPVLKSFGNLDHINQRISSLQRRLMILQNNYRLNPDTETKEAIEVYSQELSRLQKKYKLFLKQNVYAN
ncbi:MAG: hypothetical protein HC906_16265 [Bacteroidales bacterium]|nr:hypothetical protein [Bacteroidales bacterium]